MRKINYFCNVSDTTSSILVIYVFRNLVNKIINKENQSKFRIFTELKHFCWRADLIRTNSTLLVSWIRCLSFHERFFILAITAVEDYRSRGDLIYFPRLWMELNSFNQYSLLLMVRSIRIRVTKNEFKFNQLNPNNFMEIFDS